MTYNQFFFLFSRFATQQQLGAIDFLFFLRTVQLFVTFLNLIADVYAFSIGVDQTHVETSWNQLVFSQIYSNFWSKRYFFFMDQVLQTGSKKILELSDLGCVPDEDRTKEISLQLEVNFNRFQKNTFSIKGCFSKLINCCSIIFQSRKSGKSSYNYKSLQSKASANDKDTLLGGGENDDDDDDKEDDHTNDTDNENNNKKEDAHTNNETSHAFKMNRSLWKAMIHNQRHYFRLSGVAKVCADISGYISPLCLKGIIAYVYSVQNGITQSSPPGQLSMSEFFSNGFVLAGIMFTSTLFQSMCNSTHIFYVIRAAVRTRASLQVGES